MHHEPQNYDRDDYDRSLARDEELPRKGGPSPAPRDAAYGDDRGRGRRPTDDYGDDRGGRRSPTTTMTAADATTTTITIGRAGGSGGSGLVGAVGIINIVAGLVLIFWLHLLLGGAWSRPRAVTRTRTGRHDGRGQRAFPRHNGDDQRHPRHPARQLQYLLGHRHPDARNRPAALGMITAGMAAAMAVLEIIRIVGGFLRCRRPGRAKASASPGRIRLPSPALLLPTFQLHRLGRQVA
ncbi:MAG: hypothetical protein U0793_26450 [Gemmataceae bacterium]